MLVGGSTAADVVLNSYTDTVKGQLLKRYKRFLADVMVRQRHFDVPRTNFFACRLLMPLHERLCNLLTFDCAYCWPRHIARYTLSTFTITTWKLLDATVDATRVLGSS